MDTQQYNNFFGDMDLFLMDLILKGHIKEKAKILDIGCGGGRNGIYFIQQGFEYHGWDVDDSQLKLLEYLSQTIDGSVTHFKKVDLRQSKTTELFDVVLCSRVLHFADSVEDFENMWCTLVSHIGSGGILYVAMDSVVESTIGRKLSEGKAEFPDGKVRFVLTEKIYQDIKEGFEEIEPLRTLLNHGERAQSFMCLKKI